MKSKNQFKIGMMTTLALTSFLSLSACNFGSGLSASKSTSPSASSQSSSSPSATDGASPSYDSTLHFAHFASGYDPKDTSKVWVTNVTIANNDSVTKYIATDAVATDSNGNIYTTDIEFITDCQVDSSGWVIVAPYGACDLESNGDLPLESGWLDVYEQSNGIIDGQLTYTYFNDNQYTGTVDSVVAVPASPLMSDFSLAVVSENGGVTQGNGTAKELGFALGNPWSEATSVRMDLYDMDGQAVDSPVQIDLAAFGHTAFMLSQYFPSIANSQRFVGNLYISGITTADYVTATALIYNRGRFGGALLTNLTPSSSDQLSSSSSARKSKMSRPAPAKISAAARSASTKAVHGANRVKISHKKAK